MEKKLSGWKRLYLSRGGRLTLLKSTCGAEKFDDPGPFHIKPKAHVKDEEMSEDERRRSKTARRRC